MAGVDGLAGFGDLAVIIGESAVNIPGRSKDKHRIPAHFAQKVNRAFDIREKDLAFGFGRFVQDGGQMDHDIVIARDLRILEVQDVEPGAAGKIIRAKKCLDVSSEVTAASCDQYFILINDLRATLSGSEIIPTADVGIRSLRSLLPTLLNLSLQRHRCSLCALTGKKNHRSAAAATPRYSKEGSLTSLPGQPPALPIKKAF